MSIEVKSVIINQQGNHDKIWGYFTTSQSNTYSFWGRRDKKLRFKKMFDQAEACDKACEKIDKKGYRNLPSHKWPDVVGDLSEQIEEYFTMDVMMDRVL